MRRVVIGIISGNPLGVYAVLKDVLQLPEEDWLHSDHAILICSAQSAKTAQTAVELLQEVAPAASFQILNIGNNIRNVRAIEEEVQRGLEELGEVDGIHLNYTGGTKSMSLGAFLGVDHFQRPVRKIYSDINHADNTLYFFDEEPRPLAQEVQLKIDELLALFLNRPRGSFHYKREVSPFYDPEFCQFLFQKKVEKDKQFWEIWDKPEDKLEQLVRGFEERGEGEDIFESLGKFKEWIKPTVYQPGIGKKRLRRNLKNLRKFIRGEWLEDYLFKILEELQSELNLSDYGVNVFDKTPEGSNSFEVDLMAIRGYNPYLISCTTETENKTILTHKANEAMVRARQLGGIRTKPILVALTENRQVLENLIRGARSFDVSQLELMLRSDLSEGDHLSPEKIKEWFKRVIR